MMERYYETPEELLSDYKSRLQEVCQASFKLQPEYRIVKRVGPEHRKIFPNMP